MTAQYRAVPAGLPDMLIKTGHMDWKGEKALAIESEELRLVMLPDMGGKIASIYSKTAGLELLFQPSDDRYKSPGFGMPFELSDTSGIDEMLPTIDSCLYPEGIYRGTHLPDHGSAWSVPWDCMITDNSISGSVCLSPLAFNLNRTISFRSVDEIAMAYVLTNNTDHDLYYLWALHPLFRFFKDTVIVLPDDCREVISVMDSIAAGPAGRLNLFPINPEGQGYIDLSRPAGYPDKNAAKWYCNGPVTHGRAALDHKEEGLRLELSWNAQENPYFGVWVNNGGYKNEKNIALEPANGFYDSLEKAWRNKNSRFIKSGCRDCWHINIRVIAIR